MTTLKISVVCIVISFTIVTSCNWLESDFLIIYLREQLITILLTLLAINTATLGLLASKLQEAIAKYPLLDIKNPVQQMKNSLVEQFVLIIIGIVALIISDSAKLVFETKWYICDIVIVAVFIYSIDILRDTGISVFTLINEMEKKN